MVFLYSSDLSADTATAIRARVTAEAVRRKMTAHVLAWGGDPSWVETLPFPVRPDVASGKRPITLRFRLRHFTREALRRLEALKPRVIHATTPVAVAPAALYKLRHPSTRLVFEIHGIAFLETRELRLPARLTFGLLDFLGARCADAVIGMSYTQRELLRRWFRVRPEKVHVLWGPVDLAMFAYEDPQPAPPLLVGYSGNDRFWQGVHTILDAAQLLRGHDDIRFVLMGFPKERYLERNLPNVDFLGVPARDDVPKLLSRCHALLSPRVGGLVADSQYPFKLSAYLALGRPIIASIVSDQPLILKQADCGLVFPPENPQALADAVLQLREMPETRRLELGRNARGFAEQHLSLEHLTEALLRVYNTRPT